MPHPPDTVWEVLSDPATVIACIDGSKLGEQHDDGTFDAQLAVKFAAIRVGFAARVALELEEAEHVGRMEARGADSRGSTRVQGRATFTVVPATVGSEVAIDGDVELTGQLASLITTGAAVVVDRMTRTFTEKLTATCAERDAATAAAGLPGSLGQRSARRGLAAWLRRTWQHLREGWSAWRVHGSQRNVGS